MRGKVSNGQENGEIISDGKEERRGNQAKIHRFLSIVQKNLAKVCPKSVFIPLSTF